MSDIPLNILQKLREREGLEPDDESKDGQFDNMSPIMKLREVCAWELGSDTWADQFINWAEDCGFTITRNGADNGDSGSEESEA